MNRKDFLQSLIAVPLAGTALKMNALHQLIQNQENTEQLPVLFVGHGSPMNAIEDNEFTRGMKGIAKTLPKPKAILMISAHWETKGTFVTGQEKPPTIHDFGGFPEALFKTEYPAPGSKWLSEETKNAVKTTTVNADTSWGFDHGAWSVAKNLFPDADVPMIQMSLDYTKNAQHHYDLGKELATLRKKGVLIIGSGNMVHNFAHLQVKSNNFNERFGHSWAIEANEKFKKFICNDDHASLINYNAQGKELQLSIPTPEHYLPLLYVLALKEKKEEVSFFNDALLAGSFSMTSLVIK